MLQAILICVALALLTTVKPQATWSNRNTKANSLWSEAANLKILSTTIEAVSEQIEAEFHLYINLNETEANETLNSLLASNKRDVPQLIVAQDTNVTKFEVRSKFTSQLLTIAFVNAANMLTVRQKVNQLLWARHFRNVLFVFNAGVAAAADSAVSTASELHPLHKLFTACWRNGFVSVAALYTDGLLYRYHPFPSVRVVLLPNVAAYANQAPLLNFLGYKLRSPINHSPPRCYHYVDRNGNIATSGYVYKIVRTFIEHYNGTFEELVMPTYQLNFEDILKAFRARKIDIVANLYYINREFAHSHIINNYNAYIIAPFAQPIPEYFYFMRPFKGKLWTAVVCLFAYVVILLTFINWRQTHKLDFGATMLEVMEMLLFLPHNRRRIQSRIQLLTFVLLLLVGFLLTNYYMAKLSSLLANTVYGYQINSFDEIAKTNLLLPQIQLDRNYIREFLRVHPGVLDRIWLASSDVVHNLRITLNTSFLHSGVEDRIHFTLYQQKFLKVPLFRRINEIMYSLPAFVPVPHGSPFLLLLNRFLRRISESGILLKIINENEEDGIRNHEIHFFRSSTEQQPRLTLKHFVLALALWIVGLLLACCVYVYEILLSKRRIYRRVKNY